MNLVAGGLTLTGIGAVCFIVIFREYIKKGYINKNEVIVSKFLLVIILVGLMLTVIGWAALMSGMN